MDAPSKRLLNLKEAAAYCGVGASTFKTQTRITPIKIGKCVRYDVHAIDRWIDNQTQLESLTGDDWLAKMDED